MTRGTAQEIEDMRVSEPLFLPAESGLEQRSSTDMVVLGDDRLGSLGGC